MKMTVSNSERKSAVQPQFCSFIPKFVDANKHVGRQFRLLIVNVATDADAEHSVSLTAAAAAATTTTTTTVVTAIILT